MLTEAQQTNDKLDKIINLLENNKKHHECGVCDNKQSDEKSLIYLIRLNPNHMTLKYVDGRSWCIAEKYDEIACLYNLADELTIKISTYEYKHVDSVVLLTVIKTLTKAGYNIDVNQDDNPYILKMKKYKYLIT